MTSPPWKLANVLLLALADLVLLLFVAVPSSRGGNNTTTCSSTTMVTTTTSILKSTLVAPTLLPHDCTHVVQILMAWSWPHFFGGGCQGATVTMTQSVAPWLTMAKILAPWLLQLKIMTTGVSLLRFAKNP
jgi:hypothetical protein